MKTNLSLDMYVWLFLARAVYCSLVIAAAGVGLAMIVNDGTGNHYRMAK